MSIKNNSELRIIAGKFRSRKITFSDAIGLRPTHDRIRETLFNWLNNDIVDSLCLDCFAGSGALGFEALSRGAKHVTFIENHKNSINNLKLNAENLKLTSDEINFICSDFFAINPILLNKQFDLIFLDPPFKQNLILSAIIFLEKNNLLKDNALIYLEFEKNGFDINSISNNFKIVKHKHTKTIEYALISKIILC